MESPFPLPARLPPLSRLRRYPAVDVSAGEGRVTTNSGGEKSGANVPFLAMRQPLSGTSRPFSVTR